MRFNAGQLLGGSWDPYPIDMQFAPPCMVLSTIGLASPGKIERGARAASCSKHLHQLHICLPSSEGGCRGGVGGFVEVGWWGERFWQSVFESKAGGYELLTGPSPRLVYRCCTAPCTAGRTRLLYRMSMDFMHWTRFVPGIAAFWRSIASQVRGVRGRVGGWQGGRDGGGRGGGVQGGWACWARGDSPLSLPRL